MIFDSAQPGLKWIGLAYHSFVGATGTPMAFHRRLVEIVATAFDLDEGLPGRLWRR